LKACNLTQFTELGLSEPILRALKAEGYETPTPIQEQFIPQMLAGRDLVGIAQTGTGKTAAFLLPILNSLAATTGPVEPKACRALILTPTRELAAQIEQAIRTYGRNVRYTVALVVGGAKPFPQIRALSRGVDIVVATPGRLVDHMQSRAIRLDKTVTLVLDEADQMLDLGFLPAVREISEQLAKTRQTVLTSATMPKQIRALIHDLLTDPKHISVTHESRPIEAIAQQVILCNRESKRSLLLDILSDREMKRAIVFARTKRGADRVHEHLVKYGLNAQAIHGDKSQGQRTRALDGFRAGKVKILVATDVAARGIDVDDITHVVNYEMPNVPEAYVHRIGRTARAGKSGIAISLVDNSEKGYLREIEHLIGASIPKMAAGDVVELEGDAAEAAEARRERPKPAKAPFKVQASGKGPKPAGAPRADGKRADSKGPGARRSDGKPVKARRQSGDVFKPREDRPAREGSDFKRREDRPARARTGDEGGRSEARFSGHGKPAAGSRDGDTHKRREERPSRDRTAHGEGAHPAGRSAGSGKPAGAARDGDSFKRRDDRPAPGNGKRPSGPAKGGEGAKPKFKGTSDHSGRSTVSKSGEGKVFKPRRPGSRPAR
tara:strand:+ start:9556 stop:11379 length:1824 start_codon:yes stop_codon:yes gene_type:complete